MKNLKIYLRLFIIATLLLLGACQSDVAPNNKPQINIFADISGADSLHFSATSKFTPDIDSNYYGEYIYSNYVDSLNNQYFLGFYIYFKSKIEKTGIFSFKSTKDTSFGDFAIGFFQIGNNNSRFFISDTGSVTLEIADKPKSKGTFHFQAKENGTNAIIKVFNGAFNIQ